MQARIEVLIVSESKNYPISNLFSEKKNEKKNFRTKELSPFPQKIKIFVDFKCTFTEFEIYIVFEELFVPKSLEVLVNSDESKQVENFIIRPKDKNETTFIRTIKRFSNTYYVTITFGEPHSSLTNTFEQIGLKTLSFIPSDKTKIPLSLTKSKDEEHEEIQSLIEEEMSTKYSKTSDYCSKILLPLVSQKIKMVKQENFIEARNITKKINMLVSLGKRHLALQMTEKGFIERQEFKDAHLTQNESKRIMNEMNSVAGMSQSSKENQTVSDLNESNNRIQSFLNQMEYHLDPDDFPSIVEEKKKNSEKFFKNIQCLGFGE